MVVATGVNRAITNECWAACTPGYVCDHESGLCVRGECSPRCPDTQVCAQVAEQFSCVDKGITYNTNVRGGGPVIPAGGPTPGGRAASVRSRPAPTSQCPAPGSAAWYAQAAKKPATADPPKSERQGEFVGIWSIADAIAAEPGLPPRPLIVTPSWFGRSSLTATEYRVHSDSADGLVLLATTQAREREIEVRFTGRDRFQLWGVNYRREDCTAIDPPPACCELPRAGWVRLRPADFQ